MRRALMIVALLLAGVACGSEAGDVADEARDVADEARDVAEDAADRVEDVVNDRTVTIRDNRYEPSARSVTVGTEVTWINRGDDQHTVTSENNSFASDGNLETDEEFSFRFTQAGTYDYHCEVHGADVMSGTVVVE